MYLSKKNIAITLAVIILLFPLFFGIYTEFLFINDFTLFTLTYLLIGFVLLLVLGKVMEYFMYKGVSKETMKHHEVIKALLNKNGKTILFVFFSSDYDNGRIYLSLLSHRDFIISVEVRVILSHFNFERDFLSLSFTYLV